MDFFDNLTQDLINNQPIPLKRGVYSYLGIPDNKTKVGNTFYPRCISYKISKKNKKRVTSNLINSVYDYWEENNHQFPEMSWYEKNFYLEIKSRPCNKSVTEGLIKLHNNLK